MEASSINFEVRALVRVKAAAARLGVSVRTVYRDVEDGAMCIWMR